MLTYVGSGTRWWLVVTAAVAASFGTPGVAVAAGTPGQLYAFGNNFGGELGVATDAGTSNANPTPALVTLPGATGPVRRVAISGGTSLVITSTGQLFAFGDNNFGELGSATNNGTMVANPTPTLVTLPGASGPVVDAAAGKTSVWR